MDRFHSVYSIGRETSERIYVVGCETDKTASDIQARSFMARTLDEIGKKCLVEGDIAGRGDNALQHYNLVHKFTPMPQAMKIPAAEAAVDK